MKPAAKRTLPFTIALALIAGGAGCSLRSVATSVPPRVFREVHGLRVRSYQMMPVTSDLRQYKAIEIHKLNNLMLDEIPLSPRDGLSGVADGFIDQVTRRMAPSEK